MTSQGRRCSSAHSTNSQRVPTGSRLNEWMYRPPRGNAAPCAVRSTDWIFSDPATAAYEGANATMQIAARDRHDRHLSRLITMVYSSTRVQGSIAMVSRAWIGRETAPRTSDRCGSDAATTAVARRCDACTGVRPTGWEGAIRARMARRQDRKRRTGREGCEGGGICRGACHGGRRVSGGPRAALACGGPCAGIELDASGKAETQTRPNLHPNHRNSGAPDRNRTCIKSFGNSHSIH